MLAEGPEAHDLALREMKAGMRDFAKDKATDVASALSYLRDRIGVPRDMPLAAARQFRAHLNAAINVLNS
jgi:hypothetical protein